MAVEPYNITYPRIQSGSEYYFQSDSGMDYEVRFARKKNNIFHVTIAFGVTNEEFEGEEYSLTNKGEAYRVMTTIVKIVKDYMKNHPNVKTFEFVGEPTAGEDADFPKKRLNLYQRYLRNIFDESWKFTLIKNKMLIEKTSD